MSALAQLATVTAGDATRDEGEAANVAKRVLEPLADIVALQPVLAVIAPTMTEQQRLEERTASMTEQLVALNHAAKTPANITAIFGLRDQQVGILRACEDASSMLTHAESIVVDASLASVSAPIHVPPADARLARDQIGLLATTRRGLVPPPLHVLAIDEWSSHNAALTAAIAAAREVDAAIHAAIAAEGIAAAGNIAAAEAALAAAVAAETNATAQMPVALRAAVEAAAARHAAAVAVGLANATRERDNAQRVNEAAATRAFIARAGAVRAAVEARMEDATAAQGFLTRATETLSRA